MNLIFFSRVEPNRPRRGPGGDVRELQVPECDGGAGWVDVLMFNPLPPPGECCFPVQDFYSGVWRRCQGHRGVGSVDRDRATGLWFCSRHQNWNIAFSSRVFQCDRCGEFSEFAKCTKCEGKVKCDVCYRWFVQNGQKRKFLCSKRCSDIWYFTRIKKYCRDEPMVAYVKHGFKTHMKLREEKGRL